LPNNPQSKTYADALFEAKRGFVIIGLTGYTGSGCTTTSRILGRSEKFRLPKNFGEDLEQHGQTFGKRHFAKLEHAWEEMEWKPYTEISVGTIILALVLRDLIEYPSKHEAPELIKEIANENFHLREGIKLLSKPSPLDDEDALSLIKTYTRCSEIQEEIRKNKSIDISTFIYFMQSAGDKIRLFGSLSGSTPEPKNMFIIPESIRKIISAYKKSQKKDRFVIDAFRNPFEVEYFKRRYSEFYLICIMRDHDERAASLKKYLSQLEIEKIWEKEKGAHPTNGKSSKECQRNSENIGWWITGQNIPECTQKADIYIKPKTRSHAHLQYNLARLLVLIHKPGALTPTQDEYAMQIAATARHMSGCLSRQVGATILGRHGYILGVGWNDPPEGQVPCSLRSCEELLNTIETTERAYSAFEQSETFKEHIKRRPSKSSFCFRSELAALEEQKSNEYTRALHAEENAFLQTAKVGGVSLCESTLYTTASTCTLCAKKAYQLDVKRIVFIDNYPGHAYSQTIQSGARHIKFEEFEGIIGNAFFKLYAPLIPEKDLLDHYY
jgi:dCMP deaminase